MRHLPCAAIAGLLLLAAGAPRSTFAATYFVATNGNNANPGTSIAPWRTLQHAADTVVPGDTVIVRPGTYAGFDLRVRATALSPVTFSAEPGVLILSNNPVTSDGINIEDSAYVEVTGFTIRGATRAGIRAAVCDHVTIRANVADLNGRWGIFTGFCDDLLIEGNTCSRSVIEHGIYASNSGDRPIIRGNRVFSNTGNGIHMNGDASQGGDGIISEALVEGNIIYDNGRGGGSGINCDGVQRSVIRNNLLYDNHASGISLYMIDGAEGSTNNLVVNNTVVNASDGRWCLNIQNASSGNTVRNNILYNRHSFRGSIDISSASLPGFVSNFNVVMNRFTIDGGNVITLAAWQAATGQDARSLLSTPAQLFADDTNDDYHLGTGSPAIDRGTPTSAPPADLEGNPRPIGTEVDIGAYEYCGIGGCGGALDGGVLDVGLPDRGLADLGVARDAAPADIGPRDTGARDASPPDTGPRDTGVRDASPPDSGPRDTGVRDASPPDTGPRDTGVRDASPPDTGPRDIGVRDATPADAAPSDTGTRDGAPADGAPRDATPSDATPSDATPPDAEQGDAAAPADAALSDATPRSDAAPGDSAALADAAPADAMTATDAGAPEDAAASDAPPGDTAGSTDGPAAIDSGSALDGATAPADLGVSAGAADAGVPPPGAGSQSPPDETDCSCRAHGETAPGAEIALLLLALLRVRPRRARRTRDS